MASSVLIDGDHYLDYLCRNGFRDFSLKRMFTFYELLGQRGGESDFLGLSGMHTVEFLLMVYAVGVVTGWLWLKAVLWGLLFHLLLDLVYLYRKGRMFQRALSIIEYAIRWQRMRRRGRHPELIYRSTLEAMSVATRSDKDKVRQADQQD